jgi:xylulokinase
MCLIGVDLGTTNWKVSAYDQRGRPVSTYRCRCQIHHLEKGGAYYLPEEIWETVAAGLRAVASRLPSPASVEGVAVTSFGEAGVLLDRSAHPVCPAMAWFDPRTEPQARDWLNRIDAYDLYAVTGFAPQHIASVNKLAWIRESQPDAYARARRWLCIADYVAFRLSGEQVMDYSLASRTGLFDLRSRRWDSRLLEAAGIKPSLLPPLGPSGALIGRVTAEAAALTGLPQGTPVCAGGHDHICGALAAGVTEQGLVLDSTGTAEAVLAVLDEPSTRKELCDAGLSIGAHVARDKYYLIGTLLTSGAVVEWLKAELCQEEQRRDTTSGEDVYRLLLDEAASVEPGAAGLFFLPHLRGTALPVDSLSRAAFVGLTSAHSRAHLIRAAVEGVCHELKSLLDRMEALTGVDVQQLIAIGGAVRNEFWLQLKADVAGRQVVVPGVEEATTLGAALLAGLGVGAYSSEEDARDAMDRQSLLVLPRPDLIAVYRRYHPLYERIYPALRLLSAEIGKTFGSAQTGD